MPKLACNIPPKVALACSGGHDSMAALSFLLRGRRDVQLLHYNHGTEGSDEAEDLVRSTAAKFDLDLRVGRPDKPIEPTEASWRTARYSFFKTAARPIVMAHHLNDAVEWWIFSSLRGKPKLIPVSRQLDNNVILRPFLLFTKDELAKHRSIDSYNDASNLDTKFARNRIRHNLVPEALKVNPGLFKTISNLYKAVKHG